MNGREIVITVVVAVVAMAALAMSGLLGRFGGGDQAVPPCNQLPTIATARSAVQSHPRTVSKLKAIDPSVTVEAAPECGDRGVVQIRHGASVKRAAIEKVLNENEGFGVPVVVVK